MKNANSRALALNFSFNKKWLPIVILFNFCDIFLPYFEIILSSLILDEVYNGVKSVNYFVFLIITLLAGNYIIAIFSHLLRKAYYKNCDILENNQSAYIMNASMNYDYEVLESEDYKKLKRSIEENERYGDGRNLLMRSLQGIIYDCMTLLIALYFIIELVYKLATHDFSIMSVIFIVLILALAIANVKLAKSSQAKELEMSQKIGDTMNDESRFDDAIDSYQIGKDVRLYNLDNLILNFKKRYLLDNHLKCFKWFMDNYYKNNIPVDLTSFVMKLAIYLFIFINISNGVLPVGSIIKYVGLVEMVVSAVRSLVMDSSAIKDNTPCVENYLKQFEYSSKSNEKVANGAVIPKEAEIEFKDVSFKYEGSDYMALNHINLKIDSKNCYALVGENGSGKTTLVKLLCRLYRPTEGEILLNGTDIWSYDYDEYIKLISPVFQDFKLFSMTLGENIALCEKYDASKVNDCIDRVNLKERYSEMKNGLDTNLYKDFDEEGVEISGGEGQKIALARALYKDSDLMIFDEPTAALDPRAESEIYNMMKNTLENHTVIFVSHRLSSCIFSDKIFVLHQGCLVEEGTHEKLLTNKNGKYSELWNTQAQMYQN